jgi:hypothetical protein
MVGNDAVQHVSQNISSIIQVLIKVIIRHKTVWLNLMNGGEVCFTLKIQKTEGQVDCYIYRPQYLQA